MSFYTIEELKQLQLGSVGEYVLISRKASLHNPKNIHIGNYVRIDDFCVLSAGKGGIHIGNHVHIAVYSSLIGAESISIQDFSNVSSRVSIYSSNDDYSGMYMSNPMIPSHLTNVDHGAVTIGKHTIIGSGSIVLPHVNLEQGVVIGALSLVKTDCTAFGIYGGVPANRIGERKRNLLELAEKMK
ncbi:acyltransferase [Thiothrix sp.]|jgi:galactoside O-acetyltransferase|uniref:acyltransferase n=1 Tax=Thiothrix sp. TaxID=1032 RepID=UPI002580F24C|nr:acyltransferase [Thiothrix sp.]